MPELFSFCLCLVLEAGDSYHGEWDFSQPFFLYTTRQQRGIEIVEDDINCHEYDDTRTMLITTPMTKKRRKKKKREREKKRQ